MLSHTKVFTQSFFVARIY